MDDTRGSVTGSGEGTFLHAVAKSAGLYPDNIAVAVVGDACTYRTLWEMSESIACFIAEAAGTQNTPIVVFSEKSPLMIACMLACSKSGHSYVPVDASTPLPRVCDILSQTAAPLIFALSTLDCGAIPTTAVDKPYAPTVLSLEDISEVLGRFKGAVTSEAQWVSGEDTHYMIFTSGSTGAPKGVQVTASCLDHFYTWPLSLLEPGSRPKVFLNQALFSFDLSVYELAMSLSSGGTLVCAGDDLLADMAAFFDFLGSFDVQVMSVTPSFLEMCLVDRTFDEKLLPCLETVLFCGEALPASVAGKLIARFPRTTVYNTYGPTESTVAVTAIPITARELEAGDPLPVGFPKPGTRIVIIDDDGRPAKSGEMGEIVICGTTVAKGYFGRPDLTARSFGTDADGIRSYRTGDLGYLDACGCLFCSGRKDSQIKLNGFRIELGDIENNLISTGLVRTTAVLCTKHEGRNSYLVAFITIDEEGLSQQPSVSRTDAHQVSQLIKEKLKIRLPHYMIPRKIVILDELPMTSNGKIDRRSLQERL